MFNLQIKTDNAAFTCDDPTRSDDEACRNEIVRILKEVIRKIENEDMTRSACMDINGNLVGGWNIDE